MVVVWVEFGPDWPVQDRLAVYSLMMYTPLRVTRWHESGQCVGSVQDPPEEAAILVRFGKNTHSTPIDSGIPIEDVITIPDRKSLKTLQERLSCPIFRRNRLFYTGKPCGAMERLKKPCITLEKAYAAILGEEFGADIPEEGGIERMREYTFLTGLDRVSAVFHPALDTIRRGIDSEVLPREMCFSLEYPHLYADIRGGLCAMWAAHPVLDILERGHE